MMGYRPPLLLRSGHFNTVYSTLFRKQPDPDYQRQKITTPDGDFLHIDMIRKANKRLAILCHGLEGSSHSNYIIGAAGLLSEKGWDIVAINYRGCSGEMNNSLRMYHSGATDDLQTVLNAVFDAYNEIAIVGFSLGGNLAIKYCGEKGAEIDPRIKSVVAVSVPLDLGASSKHIGRPANFIYETKFLWSLKSKIRKKHAQFPEQIKIELLDGVKTLYDFDDKFTAPIHGFKNASHYYSECSSKSFLEYLTVPCLVLNAKDDPFLPEECYPDRDHLSNTWLNFETPEYGGHVGFVQPGKKYYWSEEKILWFIDSHSSYSNQ